VRVVTPDIHDWCGCSSTERLCGRFPTDSQLRRQGLWSNAWLDRFGNEKLYARRAPNDASSVDKKEPIFRLLVFPDRCTDGMLGEILRELGDSSRALAHDASIVRKN